jgi:hypothetical protein
MKTYIVKLNNNHQKIILDCLGVYKSLFMKDLQSIIQFIYKESNEKWLHNISDNENWLHNEKKFDEFRLGCECDFTELINQIDLIYTIVNQDVCNESEVLIKSFTEIEISKIINALDFALRIICGQLLEICNVLNFISPLHIKLNRDKIESIVKDVKMLVFKNLSFYASHGIYGIDTPMNARIGFEMIQVLRHEIWENSVEKKQHIVSAVPVHHETGFPLIEIAQC